jgi:hypothetical protein
MVLYNLTNVTNASNVGELIIVANREGTNGILFGFFMIAIFFIILLSLRRSTVAFEDSLLVASFLCFLVSAIAVYGGFLNIIFPLAFLIILALTGFFSWMSK